MHFWGNNGQIGNRII